MNWKFLSLADKHLNVSALQDWKNTFLEMDIWMQAVLVGTLVLLIGVSILSCWWGLKMNRVARFAAGAAGIFHIALITMIEGYGMENHMALIWAAVAGVAGGLLYAFLERIFQFVAGFIFGTVFSAWFLPTCFSVKATSGKGRIWTIVIAIGAGVLFALLAKKLKLVITALEGGVILGLLCDAFLPVADLPWVKDRLTGTQIWNVLPFVFAGTGILIQFLQWLAIRAEQKSLLIPSGEEREDGYGGKETDDVPGGKQDGADGTTEPEEVDEDEVSLAQAEEVLVEKAKELALAASKGAQQARLRERYEDVSEGMYSAEVAARKLGMTEEEFIKGMRKAGFQVPGMEGPRPLMEDGESPEADPETAPETDPESAPETDPETAPETDPETDPETAPETDPETAPEADPETASETAPEADPETAPEADPETAPETDPEAVPETAPETAPEAAPETAPETSPETDPEIKESESTEAGVSEGSVPEGSWSAEAAESESAEAVVSEGFASEVHPGNQGKKSGAHRSKSRKKKRSKRK